MSAGLIVRTEAGTVLYDTTKLVYGLLKSGPVTYHGTWQRIDPSGGASYFYDYIYSFRVTNAISPIVFTVGMCNKPFISKEGNDTVFYFAGSVSGVKVYCFDIMANVFHGPGLRTRITQGQVSFNSLQNPLNVIGVSTPPAPSGPTSSTVPVQGFYGGYDQVVVYQSGLTQGFYTGSFWSRALNPSIEYAAYIPWSRGCFMTSWNEDVYRYGLHEGCYGFKGGVTHHFGISPETTCGSMHSTTRPGVTNLSTSPLPACSYINTAEYPYPFDPAQ
ncbi:hypothetical protein [Pseudomonas sp. LD120]|uniref:hypothetical protein n=1 Tax=Pseudomonas sp. LD120 TaxID=485751 RepID=UPI00135C14E0|nr:hypothetical protein [Pseudomonas sp. LD120]KAF0865940.1 hypothetical protein PLD_11900 [Pseudomonas sp. LD120]